jgi:hypothetical protein
MVKMANVEVKKVQRKNRELESMTAPLREDGLVKMNRQELY